MKGSYIKNIIKLSGASVKITPLSPEESKTVVERQVLIVGSPDAQWKAQYYIYEKIRQERFTSDENVKLRAELRVPAAIVGRIIGKSGKNVRELQRSTGATIKLPEDMGIGSGGAGGASQADQSDLHNTSAASEQPAKAEDEEAQAQANAVTSAPAENGTAETATAKYS